MEAKADQKTKDPGGSQLSSGSVEDSKLAVTKQQRRRISAMLGRIKGESIEALERVEKAVGAALGHLRNSQDGEMPGPMANEMHAIHAGLGRVLSGQQRRRGMRDALEILHVSLAEEQP